MNNGPRSGRVSQGQKQNGVQCNLIQFSDLSKTARPDEVIPVDGAASQEKTGDVNSMSPRATCGGMTAALEHVELRVEDSQLGGATRAARRSAC